MRSQRREDVHSSGHLCPVCESPAADPCVLSGPDRFYGTPGTFCVSVCAECGCGWTLPPASAEELASFYPQSYDSWALQAGLLGAVQRAGQRLIFDRAFTRLPLRVLTERPPGELLDVGCGRGDLGAALIRRGWRVSGVDPSPSACAVARRRGVEAHIGTLDSVRLSGESFDAVIMSHSLEHVPDLRAELTRVLRLLRAAGLVIISVPNFACWQRERFRAAWFPLDLPRHRTHFTPTSLELALTTVGFDVLSVDAASDNGFSLFTTLQYAMAGRLLLRPGPSYWPTYAFSPLNRVIDRARGQGALLHAVGRRPTRRSHAVTTVPVFR